MFPASRNSTRVRHGAASSVLPLSVASASNGVGLPTLAELLSLHSVTEAPFVVGTVVEAAVEVVVEADVEAVVEADVEVVVEAAVVASISAEVTFEGPPTAAPSFGDCWSETSPSDDLYHWHWKSFFHISAGSASCWFVTFAASVWEER